MRTRAERRKTSAYIIKKRKNILKYNKGLLLIKDNGHRIVARPIGTVNKDIKKETSRAIRHSNDILQNGNYKKIKIDALNSYLDW